MLFAAVMRLHGDIRWHVMEIPIRTYTAVIFWSPQSTHQIRIIDFLSLFMLRVQTHSSLSFPPGGGLCVLTDVTWREMTWQASGRYHAVSANSSQSKQTSLFLLQGHVCSQLRFLVLFMTICGGSTKHSEIKNTEKRGKSLYRHSESESESELLYDWRFSVNQFVLAPSPLRLTTRDFFFATEPLWS
jgi:hypothetical protein